MHILLYYIVGLRSKFGDRGTDYTQEHIREVCAQMLALLQEKQDNETNSASELMITEVYHSLSLLHCII